MKIQNFLPPKASLETNDFFHPATAVLSDGRWMMTFQRLQNCDCYGGAEILFSEDNGQSWGEPRLVTELRTTPLNDELLFGIADVRPLVSEDGGSVVLVGCDTTYTNRGAACYDHVSIDPVLYEHGAYYTVFNVKDNTFGARRILRNPALDPDKLWRVSCAQSTFASDGDWILPAHFEHRSNIEYEKGYFSPRFAVETVKVHLEGDELVPVAWGTQLFHENKRGFIEPSLIRGQKDYLMTIRAEDGFAYVSRSDDGLQWADPVPWRFDDGTALVTESTQQHWLTAGGRIFLVYTRKCDANANDMRYRSILFMAEVDDTTAMPVLKKATEIELFPQRERDGIHGLLGNFHVCNLSDGTALVCDSYLYQNVEGDDIVEHFNEVALKRVTC
ncbi:MAG: hypothetical protein MJ106_04065 [Lentisphaeria bacterium]|nr:hypothetical protein [Lentisphaeria bacterium]